MSTVVLSAPTMRKKERMEFSPKNLSSQRENDKKCNNNDNYRNIYEINNESQSAYSKNAVKININIDYFEQCISLWCPLIRGMFFKGMDTEVIKEHSSTSFYRYLLTRNHFLSQLHFIHPLLFEFVLCFYLVFIFYL